MHGAYTFSYFPTWSFHCIVLLTSQTLDMKSNSAHDELVHCYLTTFFGVDPETS